MAIYKRLLAQRISRDEIAAALSKLGCEDMLLEDSRWLNQNRQKNQMRIEVISREISRAETQMRARAFTLARLESELNEKAAQARRFQRVCKNNNDSAMITCNLLAFESAELVVQAKARAEAAAGSHLRQAIVVEEPMHPPYRDDKQNQEGERTSRMEAAISNLQLLLEEFKEFLHRRAIVTSLPKVN